MSWDHLPDFIKPDLWLDENHAIDFTTQQGADGPTGALFVHRDKRDMQHWCVGGFQWAGTGPLWTLESLDPLTVHPSVQCLSCGDHGFIRDGKWVPA